MKPVDFILRQPWAMLPDMIGTLVAIADRVNEAPEAVAAKLGKPLENTQTMTVRDGVAVLPVRGPISRYASWFSEISGATSVDVLARDFCAALDDPAIRGIVLEIDSPGGQAAGIGELAAMIRAGSAQKPVTGYVSSLGASAGYWLAAACPRLVVAPTAILGSIGVVQPVSLPRKDDKGPRTIEFVSSQSPLKRPDPESDAGKAEIQATVDALAEVFIADVARYRKTDPKTVAAKFGRGGLKVGKAAVDAGMADSLGSLESIIEDMCKMDSRGRRAESPQSPHASGAPAAEPTEKRSMKVPFSKVFTVWMNKGRPEVLDTADLAEATATEPAEDVTPEATEVAKEDTAAIAAGKAELSKGWADLRKGRIETYSYQAEAFLSLMGDRVTPAEREGLKSAYVAAALIDAEAPVEGFSALGGFRGGVESRKPHVQTREIVQGDAKTIGDHLSANGLKTLDNAAASPDEARKQAEDAQFRKMMESTEEGRAALAEMDAK